MSNEPTEKKHFILDEKFQLLKQCQKEIFTETEISPSIRKIVNDLINEVNLKTIKHQFTEIWRT